MADRGHYRPAGIGSGRNGMTCGKDGGKAMSRELLIGALTRGVGRALASMGAAPYGRRFVPLALLWLAAWVYAAPVQAQTQTAISARIDWYGVYTKSKTETIKDASSPTGQRFVTTPVGPRENSDRIPGRDDVQFGVSYILSGNKGRNVTVKHIYLFPGEGMPNSATGEKVKTYEFVRDDAMGDPVLIGWSFENAPPERIVLGDWILQVWAGNRLLLEKRMTVYPP
jgi:hypothetical protein